MLANTCRKHQMIQSSKLCVVHTNITHNIVTEYINRKLRPLIAFCCSFFYQAKIITHTRNAPQASVLQSIHKEHHPRSIPSFCKNGIINGSMSPQRLELLIPTCSEIPKLVSTLLPSSIAHKEQLAPQMTGNGYPRRSVLFCHCIRDVFIGCPRDSRVCGYRISHTIHKEYHTYNVLPESFCEMPFQTHLQASHPVSVSGTDGLHSDKVYTSNVHIILHALQHVWCEPVRPRQ